MKTRWTGFAGLAAILLLPAIGCDRKQVAAVEKQPVRVMVAPLVQSDFQRRIRVQGTVKPTEEAEIASRTTGTVDILAVKEGDQVEKGQLLFQVDKINLENQVQVAEQELSVARDSVVTAAADLHIAQTKQEKAQLDFNRAEKLVKSKVISRDAYENAEVNLKNRKAETDKYEAILRYSNSKVEQQQVQLKIARKNLEDSLVRAPFSGTITRKYQDQDEYVTNGTVLLHLENQNQLELSCMISAVYYNAIEPGRTRGRVLFDGHAVCTPQLSYRASSVDPLSRTFEIKAPLPEKVDLVSGTLCDMELILEEREGFGLPSDAVMLRKGGQYLAYVVRDGEVEAVDVEPGITADGRTEVRNADRLAHEQFIVTGQYFVNPGDKVTIGNPAPELAAR